MMIHDVKDDPILQDSSQEPSMSSQYDLAVYQGVVWSGIGLGEGQIEDFLWNFQDNFAAGNW